MRHGFGFAAAKKLEFHEFNASPREIVKTAQALAEWYASSAEYDHAFDCLTKARLVAPWTDAGQSHLLLEIEMLLELGRVEEAKKARCQSD